MVDINWYCCYVCHDYTRVFMNMQVLIMTSITYPWVVSRMIKYCCQLLLCGSWLYFCICLYESVDYDRHDMICIAFILIFMLWSWYSKGWTCINGAYQTILIQFWMFVWNGNSIALSLCFCFILILHCCKAIQQRVDFHLWCLSDYIHPNTDVCNCC